MVVYFANALDNGLYTIRCIGVGEVIEPRYEHALPTQYSAKMLYLSLLLAYYSRWLLHIVIWQDKRQH